MEYINIDMARTRLSSRQIMKESIEIEQIAPEVLESIVKEPEQASGETEENEIAK